MATATSFHSSSSSLLEEWVPCQNSEGQVYWYNKSTGQVAWDRPQTFQPPVNAFGQDVRGSQMYPANYPSQQQYYQPQQQFQQPDPRMATPQIHSQYPPAPEFPPQQPGYARHEQMPPQFPGAPRSAAHPGPTNAPNEQWMAKLDKQLFSMSIVELERHLGSMGIRCDVQNKSQMSQMIRNVYKRKLERGEPVRLPFEGQTHHTSGGPPPGHPRDRERPFNQRNNSRPPRNENPRNENPRHEKTNTRRRQQKREDDNSVVNWGAVRQLGNGQWQTRTPDGKVLEQLFSTRESATEYLRERKRNMVAKERSKNKPHYHSRSSNHTQDVPKQGKIKKQTKDTNRAPSPPTYIAPMPADLWDDDDDDDGEPYDPVCTHVQQRPCGREIVPDVEGMQRFVLTSSVELRSIYQNGFEEWKPSKPWDNENEPLRQKVTKRFKSLSRTSVITQTGIVYTERIDNSPPSRVEIEDGLSFTYSIRFPAKSKFLIRLQHAVEHQLAVALYRANFTRMSGETTPMYVFMAQSSGHEIRMPNGKTITNFSGVVPHVKIRNQQEIHLEMVPAEKSFLTKTVRDMINRGKPKTFFRDYRALARTATKLMTITILNITDALSAEAKDPATDLTVQEMSKIRGAAFSYGDSVVVETSHGLFSSDEIYPSAHLTKKEQAARDRQLKKHRYCDRQAAHFQIVRKFQAELLESIKRHHVGLELGEDLICAPCHYLPEVQVKRSDGKAGDSIGSKSRHHEWDRLLRKTPANLKLESMAVIADTRFREMNSLTKIFRALTYRRPWIPEPRFFQCGLQDLVKIWDTRPKNTIRVTFEDNITQEAIEEYFGQFGSVGNVKLTNRTCTVSFRNAACCAGILAAVDHVINGVNATVSAFIRLNNHQRKVYTPIFLALREVDGIVVFLPGKEGCSQATQLKNRMTLMINGEDGLNPCALQFIMAGHIRHNSKRSLPILQEALEAGLVPKTGAITFEIDSQRCPFDLVIAIDVSTIQGERVASITATNRPYEGSLSSLSCTVTKLDPSTNLGDLIGYDQMTKILVSIGLTGRNILLYRHNACIDSRDLFENEIQALVDFYDKSNVTLVEVTSHTSLRVLDVDYDPIRSVQAKSEFIITQKITRTHKKVIEFFIRHIAKSNPVRYSILFSTDPDILTLDSEILGVARFTHNLTKNYVHHKDGSKLPGPLKFADHISRWFGSILKTCSTDQMPRFHPKSLRPNII